MHLRLLILKLLKEGERTGYDLIKIIEKESGWKPSPGSIYPHLSELKKGNLIKVKEEGRRKIYAITAKGVRELMKMKGELSGMMENISKHVTVFEKLFGTKFEMGSALRFVFGELKKGKIPFGQLGKDMMKFRVLFLKKVMDKKNHAKMHKIVKEAHSKLEKI